MQQLSFDLRASRDRVLAAFQCLLAYVLDAAVTADSDAWMADEALVALKEKVVAEAAFHDLMVEAAAVARAAPLQ